MAISATPEPLWLTAAQVTSSVISLLSVVASLFIIGFTWVQRPSTNGYVKLADGPTLKTRKARFSKLLLSFIDDDMHENGEPVDIDGFWKEVSSRAQNKALTSDPLSSDISPSNGYGQLRSPDLHRLQPYD